MKTKIAAIKIMLGIFAMFVIMNQCALTKNTPSKTPVPLTYQNDTRGRKEFPIKWNVKGEKLFVFDPKIPAWAAYDAGGNRLMTGSASGGKNYCDDIDAPCQTVQGTFKVYSKQGAACSSKEYPLETDDSPAGGALMPYCMFFYKGYAIHGSDSVPKYNASHGCIRVIPDAAQWLNENFIEIDTKVLILPYSPDSKN